MRRAYEATKRLLDLAAALVLLAILAPLAIVLLAKARPGLLPRFERIRCVGRGGRPIVLRREAVAGARASVAWLADWPMLLSIVAGHLSFVGPRARVVVESDPPEAWRSERLAVRPGLVCTWWLQQRVNIDFDDEEQADRSYLQRRSLRTDFSIALRALLVLPYGHERGVQRASVDIAGIRLLNLGMDELVAAIEVAVRGRRPTQIAFVNPACVNIAAGDPQYRATLAHADWVCPDGIGMKIAGRLLNRPIRQNLNGTDLFPRLCESMAASGRRLYLLGARPGLAEATARWAKERFPALQIAGTRSGYFGDDEEEDLLAAIRAARPDVLLVAMGVPAQDVWLRQNLKRSGAQVGIGVGGLFDFYGGRIPRAPVWLREIGGEWIYRLIQEPRRMWRRYLVGNAVFLWRIARERAALPATARQP